MIRPGLALALLLLASPAFGQTRPLGNSGGGLSGVTSNGTVVSIASTSGQFCINSDTGLSRAAAGRWYAGNCVSTNYVAFGNAIAGGAFEVSSTGQYLYGSGAVGGVMDTGTKRGGAARVHATDGGSGAAQLSPSATASTTSLAGSLFTFGVDFESLGTPDNGTLVYCRTCDPPAAGASATCTGSGTRTGALALRTAGAWRCIGA